MNIEFLYHLWINAVIFFVICSGFKFFLKIRSTIDFSYIGIVIFAAYFGFHLNIVYGLGLLGGIAGSFLASIPFIGLLLYLSARLQGIYFVIGTLSLYMLMVNFAANLESITGGVFGISLVSQHIIGSLAFTSIDSFFVWYSVLFILIAGALLYIRKAFFYQILQGWGENEGSLKAIGYQTHVYRLIMITITALLASIGGNLYGYYNAYIEPTSFWLVLLTMILTISLVSYKLHSIGTLIISFFVIGSYEYIRFFKFVDPAQIGYVREMIFGFIIMGVVYVVFKHTDLGRQI